MCAIFGMGFLRHDVNMEVMSTVLKKLTALSQVRGSDATGLCFTTRRDISVVKHNVEASKFISLKEYGCEVDRFMSSKDHKRLYSVLGHCRQQTKGAHTINLNNHPIHVGDIVGAHNGVICNDDELFKEYAFNRLGQVDSEVIFSLIDYYSNLYKRKVDELSPTTSAIIKTSGLINGSFACSIVDAKSPNNIWIFKNSNPVVIHNFKKEGVVIYASTLPILRSAIEHTDFETPEEIILKNDQGVCIDLLNCKYNTFDLHECTKATAMDRYGTFGW